MKGWRKCGLGDALTLQRGFDLPDRDRVNGDVPVVSSSGITGYHNVAMVKAPGVVTGRYGTIGEVFYISNDFWPLNTSLYVKDFKGNSIKYISYLLKTYISANQNAAGAVPGVNRNHLHKISIILPSLPIQRKIAAVLSSYDELIENNNKRIGIMEKMAEELYREWFVRLRFPGHENVKIMKGVPEGWERKKLGDLAEYINGYPFSPEDWKSEGLPIIKIKELKEGITAQTPRNNGETIPKKLHIKNGDLLFSWSGSLEVVLWNEGNGLVNQHLFKVIPHKGIPYSFMFLCLTASIPTFACLTTGATMQHIKRKELNHVEVCFGSTDMLFEFDSIVDPLLKNIQHLKVISKYLFATRDRLLSRLMSGKIDLENIDIEFPQSMKDEVSANA